MKAPIEERETTPKNERYKIPSYLRDKQTELMWALAAQDYSPAQIQLIFGFKHLSTVTRIIDKLPPNYISPWVKRIQIA